jgi:hypothetical protein
MRWGISVIVLVILVLGGFFSYLFYFNDLSDEASFDVDSVLIKTVIVDGSNYESAIKVTNLLEKQQSFEITFDNLDGVVSPGTEGFSLGAGEIREVSFSFFDDGALDHGIYVGAINVVTDNSKKRIPIILEVESNDVLFDGSVEVYPMTRIYQGDKMNAEIKIFDLSRIGRSTVEVTYFVKNLFDEVLIAETETLTVDDQISTTKPISLSERIVEGDYVFGVSMKYKNSFGTASSLFIIEEKKSAFGFFDNDFSYFLILGTLILIVILGLVIYSIYSRDRLLEELKNQYKFELRRQSSYVSKKEKEVEGKLKTKKEKEVSKKLFRSMKRRKIKEVDRVHMERVSKIRVLKKAKKKSEAQRQIEKWKKQGYNTSVLEKNSKVPTLSEIKGRIGSWKKQGYNTSVLEKKNRKV